MRPLHILLAMDPSRRVRGAAGPGGAPDQASAPCGEGRRRGYPVYLPQGRPGNLPCPDVLLLDLNLPKADGRQVLRELRRHPECAATPVIVVPSSGAAWNRTRLEELGVSRYFLKPADLDEFLRLGAVVRAVVGEGGA